MTRFFHWRKMTWALLLWSGGIVGWALYSVAGKSDECVSNFGPNSEFITRQDCLTAATGGIGGSAVIWIALFGVLGFGALSFVWFSSRPLWRHGRGLRLRRLPGIATGWAPRKLS